MVERTVIGEESVGAADNIPAGAIRMAMRRRPTAVISVTNDTTIVTLGVVQTCDASPLAMEN